MLAQAGKHRSKEGVQLKELLISHDSLNNRQIHYKLAITDFEASCHESNAAYESAEQIVAPLIAYVQQYENQDNDYIWRIELLISQVYYDRNKLKEALYYAQAASKDAPAGVKSQINLATKNILSQMPADRL